MYHGSNQRQQLVPRLWRLVVPALLAISITATLIWTTNQSSSSIAQEPRTDGILLIPSTYRTQGLYLTKSLVYYDSQRYEGRLVTDHARQLPVEDLAQRLVATLQKDVEVRQIPQGVVISLPATMFEFAAIDLTQAGRVTIRRIAAALDTLAHDQRVSITAYVPPTVRRICSADLDVEGVEKVALSLEASGISRHRMRLSHEQNRHSADCCSGRTTLLSPSIDQLSVQLRIED